MSEQTPSPDKLRLAETIPFWSVHLAAVVGIALVGFSWVGLIWLAATYAVHMFTVTAIYHRYFSHRTYKMSRVAQFFFALVGTLAVQKGPLWWASHHRRHHKHSDTPEDIHSPRQRGFWWSHMFWIIAKRYREADLSNLKDFTKYRELVILEKLEQPLVVASAAALFFIGGSTALVWGFFVSIVLCWHATFTINSLAHVWGSRRYETTDDSRNNVWLALITMGEGWHNNHHHYQRSARQGFFWWEIDMSFYLLKALSVVRVVWDVQGVPAHVRDDKVSPQRLKVKQVKTEIAAAPTAVPQMSTADSLASTATSSAIAAAVVPPLPPL